VHPGLPDLLRLPYHRRAPCQPPKDVDLPRGVPPEEDGRREHALRPVGQTPERRSVPVDGHHADRHAVANGAEVLQREAKQHDHGQSTCTLLARPVVLCRGPPCTCALPTAPSVAPAARRRSATLQPTGGTTVVRGRETHGRRARSSLARDAHDRNPQQTARCPLARAWEGTRTPDLRITSALLYRLSYPGLSRPRGEEPPLGPGSTT
jgi:hypothetical protein